MKAASVVAGIFGDEAPQKLGQVFVRRGFPSAWKARLLTGGHREQWGAQLSVCHTIVLDRFPYPKIGDDTDFGGVYRGIQAELGRWLEDLQGVEVHPSAGHLSAECGQWTFFYNTDEHDGSFVVWLAPRPDGSTLLFAHLVEIAR